MSRLTRKLRRAAESSVQVEPDDVRVAVLSPMGDLCHTGFAICLAQMIQHTLMRAPANLKGLWVDSYGSSILPFSRQVLAAKALEKGATHLLWIDSDMTFPSDMVLRFMRHSEPVVGINATARRPPYRNTAQASIGEQVETTMESGGLEKVFRTGFGVAWIAADVFRAIELPWFEFQWVPEHAVFRGEDYAFFEKAKAAGYEIHVDHDVSKYVEHLGTFGFNPVVQSAAKGLGGKT